MTRSYFISFFFLDLMLSLSNAARNIEEAEGLVEAGEFFSFCSIFSSDRKTDREGLFSWLSLWPGQAWWCCDRAGWLTHSDWGSVAALSHWQITWASLRHPGITGTQAGAGQNYGNYGEERWNIINANTPLHQYEDFATRVFVLRVVYISIAQKHSYLADKQTRGWGACYPPPRLSADYRMLS